MADVTTTFGAKDVGFNATVNRMQRTLAGFQSGLGGFATRLAGLAAAFVGVQQSIAAFRNGLEMAGRLNDLSKTTGEAAGNLAMLERAFQNNGMAAEQVGVSIAKMSEFIVNLQNGSDAASKAAATLRISMTDLANKSPVERMEVLMKAIASIRDPALRTATAVDVFGRSGRAVVPLAMQFSEEMANAGKELGSLVPILNANSASLDELGDKLKNSVGNKFNELAIGFAAGITGANDFVTALSRIDAAGFGKGLGESLRVAFDAPKEAAAAVGHTLMTGVKEAGNWLLAAIEHAGRVYHDMLSNEGFYSGLQKFLEGMFAQVGRVFTSALIDGIKAAMGLMDWNPLYKPLIDLAKGQMTKLQDDIAIAGEAAANSMEQGALQMKAAFNNAAASSTIIYKDQLGAAASADKAVESWTKAKDLSAEIRDNAEKTAQSFGEGSAALTNALNDIRGFDLSPKEGPEARPDWTKSNQPPPSGGGGGSDKRGGGSERASERALTRNERIAEMQGRSRSRANDERADRLEARGFFRAADSARQKAERQRNEAMTRGRLKDLYADGYDGARNLGEAYDKYRSETPIKGRLTEKQFDEMNRGLVNDQTKTSAERAAEEEAMRDKHAPKGGGKSPAEQIFDLLKKHIPKIDEKLPQTALVYS